MITPYFFIVFSSWKISSPLFSAVLFPSIFYVVLFKKQAEK
ncbi:hypothetical protein FH5_04259 [Priestia endophytica]|nr:hypothetical protein FH5_04259 [Priestia endophytica]